MSSNSVSLNPYLQENFAPIVDELTIDKLTVTGKIPAELNGLYVRNGPNPQLPPKGSYHWFDGDGMIHGVQLQNGQASYRNRFIATTGYLHEKKLGRAVWSGMTGFPNLRQMLSRPKGMWAKNVANTALVWHKGRLLALWEMAEPHIINVPDLRTVGTLDTGMEVKSFTAHPKVDPANGQMIFFGMQMGPKPNLHYGVADQTGELVYTTRIPLAESVFMHDFAVTTNYTLFMDLPFVFSLKSMITRGVPLTFNASRPSRFGIMPRFGTADDIQWFEDDPCFVYHTLNAYEINNAAGQVEEVVLRGCRLKQGTIGAPARHGGRTANAKGKQHIPLTEADAGRLHEWRFNLQTGNVTSRQLDDQGSDFPRINEHLTGCRNQFGYVSSVQMNTHNGAPEFTDIVKHDFEAGVNSRYQYGPSRFGGEATFVPRSPQSTSSAGVHTSNACEDDGWLLSYVFDVQSGESELLVIDARSMDAEPVARVLLPQRVPYGFHGTWIPSEEMVS